MIVRITLALLFVIPAAMAYPWRSAADWWLLGVAIAVVVVLFAWWRGLFVTAMLRRRIAMWRRRNRPESAHESAEYATVALKVEPRIAGDVPLDLLAGYVDRHGVSFDKVRLVSRDAGGVRTTWIGLTLGAADNIAALRARSSQIPLQDTVSLAARQLADHLREMGWEVQVDTDADDAVDTVVPAQAKEKWRGVADDQGYLAAYRITTDEKLGDTLAALWKSDTPEIWTALEFIGRRERLGIAATCALRTAEKPGSAAPLPKLTLERGLHGPALAAMHPASDRRLLSRPVPVPPGLLSELRWPAGAVLNRT